MDDDGSRRVIMVRSLSVDKEDEEKSEKDIKTGVL
jgi:hypothetical protein